jgi:DhnA family fructose-bisphosphate aldolase class Ia
MAAYGPQSVKAMGQAFDEAWILIASQFGTPEETEIARLLLAEAILSAATKGGCDVVALKAGALQALAMDYPYRSRSRPAQAFTRYNGRPRPF